jgi:hypothetical protein
MIHTISKFQVAQHLLDQAVAAVLDRDDPLSAIVLGGAAKEVLQHLINDGLPGALSARSACAGDQESWRSAW